MSRTDPGCEELHRSCVGGVDGYSDTIWKPLAGIYKILKGASGKALWRRGQLSGTWKDVQGLFGWHGVGVEEEGGSSKRESSHPGLDL